MGALTTLKGILSGSDVTGKPVRRARRGSPTGRKRKQVDSPAEMEKQPNQQASFPTQTGGKGVSKAPPRGTTSFNPNKFPVKRDSSQVQAPPLKAAGRSEKFMGNADVVREALPYAGGKGKKPVGRYIAGGALLGGAVLYGMADSDDKGTEGGTKTPTKTATAPGGSIPKVPLKTAGTSTSTSAAPKATTVAKSASTTTGSKKRQGATMRGTELANYLGLSGDSAVRKNLVAKAGQNKPMQESPLKPKAQAYRRKMSKG